MERPPDSYRATTYSKIIYLALTPRNLVVTIVQVDYHMSSYAHQLLNRESQRIREIQTLSPKGLDELPVPMNAFNNVRLIFCVMHLSLMVSR